MTIARTFTGFPRHGTSVLDLLALTRTGWERITGIEANTVALTNEPTRPVRVYLNGRLLDANDDYTLVDKTLTFPRALVAADILDISHFYRTQ